MIPPIIIWAVKGAALFVLLILASYHDIKTRQIPDKYSIVIVLLALCAPRYENLWDVFCCLPFFIAALSVGGIGGADIKIMGAVGMVIGLVPGISAMIIGLLGMILFHFVRSLFIGKMQERQSYPLIPFLTAGIISMYLLQMP